MKIALIVMPPVAVDHPLLGIGSLAGTLRESEHSVIIFDINILLFQEHPDKRWHWQREGIDSWGTTDGVIQWKKNICKKIEEFINKNKDIDACGLHVPSSGKELAHIAKEILSENHIPTIVGGPEFFQNADPLFSQNAAVCCGEGELAIKIWLERGCQINDNKEDPVVFDLNPLPLDLIAAPDFSGFDLSLYHRKNVLPLETSRGCINNCSFCDDSRMWGKYRRKSFNLIKRDIDCVINNANHISFCDSVLNPNPKRFKTLLATLENHSLTWDGMIQARGISQSIAKAMKNSGCTDIFVGVESFDTDFLKKLNKSSASKNGFESILHLNNAGIRPSIGLIVAGPPLQTRKSFLKDLDTIKDLSGYLFSVAINPLCIPKGTPLWNEGEEQGINGLSGNKSWKFWHAGNGIKDIKIRIEWCEEAVDLLKSKGVSTGDNYEDFSHFASAFINEAENWFEGF